MSYRYYGIAGDAIRVKDVIESSSTTGLSLEVRIDLAAGVSKLDATQMLTAIENYLATENPYPQGLP